MTGTGLLIAGKRHLVPGLNILGPGDEPWVRLDTRDYSSRKTTWMRQVILHGTRGGWPQRIIPGAGQGGRGKVVADFWRGDPEHSAAQLVVDTDGTVACLCDLALHAAYHATVSNDYSVGIEMAQVGDNAIYEATLIATSALTKALCSLLGIPFQFTGDAYVGDPLPRMTSGGKDCVGVFGHRSNTTRRGRGDPGDGIFDLLEHMGAERFRYNRGEDLSVWRTRQAKLNAMGARVTVDGICGPGTMSAMKRFSLATGRDVDAAAEMPTG